MKRQKIEIKTIIEWVVITALMLILSYARIFGNVTTLAIALFVGLAYNRKNILILTPILLLSNVLFASVWQTVVISLSPCVVFIFAYVITRKLKKLIKPYHAVGLTALSLTPLFFIYGLSAETAFWALLSIVITSLLAYCCITVCYLIFIKGIRYKLIPAETLSLSGLVLALSLGLYRMKISNVYLCAPILAFFIVSAVYLFSEKGILLAVICSFSPVLSDGNTYATVFICIGAVLCLFVRHRRISFLVIPFLHLIMGLAFSFFDNYSYINTILLFVGGGIFAMLSDSVINRFLSSIGVERGYAMRTLVNRNRFDMYKRLSKVSDVLKEMSRAVAFDDVINSEEMEDITFLSKKLADSLCFDCDRRRECERMLTASTASATRDLISNAIKNGRVSILEMPPFLVEYCAKSSKMLVSCKEMLENYAVRKELTESVGTCRTLLSEQINGLSGMIDGFASEIKQAVAFDPEKERELTEALSAVNIIASEAIIYRGSDCKSLVISVREQDEVKPALITNIEKVLGKMIKSDRTQGKGVVNLTFVDAPRYDLTYGVSAKSKDAISNGDAFSVVKLSTDKVMFAICDGMGSGKDASETSGRAITLVEAFYKAGIDENGVLSLINKLLSARGGENFSALDICVVNLRRGTADFIKLGGVESVILGSGTSDVIEGGALPLGILETIKPKVARKNVTNGDMIVMFSDGITDSIGSDGVIRIGEQSKTNNPERLAESIIEDSEFVGHADDKTVLCIKIFNRI